MPGLTKALLKALLIAAVVALTGCYDQSVKVTLHEPGAYKGGDVVALDATQEKEIAERTETMGDR